MRFCDVLFVLLLPLGLVGQTIEVQPEEIRAGESATLSWDTAGAKAFILGYGPVSGKGSASVMPSASTDFTMVSETGSGIRFEAKRLLVSGAKGDDGTPALSSFGVAERGERRGIDYIDFQVAVWKLLQGKGYAVKGDYAPKRPFVTVYTDFALRPDLVDKAERIRARRLALAIDIDEPKAGAISFGVRPDLEFQYRGEDDWRPEKEGSAAKAEAMKVLQLLQSAP
jgi:hypothetical protein